MVLFRLKLAGPPAPIVDVRSLARDAAVLIGECCARDFDVAFFFWSLSSSNQFSHLDCFVLSLSIPHATSVHAARTSAPLLHACPDLRGERERENDQRKRKKREKTLMEKNARSPKSPSSPRGEKKNSTSSTLSTHSKNKQKQKTARGPGHPPRACTVSQAKSNSSQSSQFDSREGPRRGRAQQRARPEAAARRALRRVGVEAVGLRAAAGVGGLGRRGGELERGTTAGKRKRIKRRKCERSSVAGLASAGTPAAPALALLLSRGFLLPGVAVHAAALGGEEEGLCRDADAPR